MTVRMENTGTHFRQILFCYFHRDELQNFTKSNINWNNTAPSCFEKHSSSSILKASETSITPTNDTIASDDDLSSNTEVCDVCNDDAFDDDPLLFCDGCDIAVHPNCYGVQEIPEGSWFCDVCASSQNPTKVHCWLCFLSGGAFKRTTRLKWVHLFCTRFFPEVFVADDRETLEPFSVDMVDRDRFRLMCCNRYCKIKAQKGACIQCALPTCFKAVHPKCIAAAKMREIWNDDENKPRVYCENCTDDGNSASRQRNKGCLKYSNSDISSAIDPWASNCSTWKFVLLKSHIGLSVTKKFLKLLGNSLRSFLFEGNRHNWREITQMVYNNRLNDVLPFVLQRLDGHILISVSSFGSSRTQESLEKILTQVH
jgi:hypothetical protein